MANNYYLGRNPDDILGNVSRFFYGLRRNDDGELYLIRVDQITDIDETVIINDAGPPAENFEDFETELSYFEGITADHEIQYENLKYPQYKWDDRSLFYYIDDNGNFTVRINRSYTYGPGEGLV
jgi:hypothetical protein